VIRQPKTLQIFGLEIQDQVKYKSIHGSCPWQVEIDRYPEQCSGLDSSINPTEKLHELGGEDVIFKEAAYMSTESPYVTMY
jgi:hypothetical protein